jgi:hypothetical protein
MWRRAQDVARTVTAITICATDVSILLGSWRDLGNSIFDQIAPCVVIELMG